MYYALSPLACQVFFHLVIENILIVGISKINTPGRPGAVVKLPYPPGPIHTPTRKPQDKFRNT